MPDKMSNQSAEPLIRRMLNAYHFNEDTTESLIADIMMLVFNKLNDIPSTNPPALSFLNDAQTKAIARVMAATPVRIMEDEYCEAYAVHADAYGESVTAHFGRWQDQHITASVRETINGEATGKMIASRVSIPEHDWTKMDALCKAWIQFRVKMEQDNKKEEELRQGEHPW